MTKTEALIIIAILGILGFFVYAYAKNPCILPVKDIPAYKLQECLNQK